MGTLSRRQFISGTAALAAVWGLPAEALADVLAQPVSPGGLNQPNVEGRARTTLDGTIRKAASGHKAYRRLVEAPGEDFIVCTELLGRAANSARVRDRRSLCYMGHMTDLHVIDAQSPARLEPAQDSAVWKGGGACRPHETLMAYVLDQSVRAQNSVSASPVTGAPMACILMTGDVCDSNNLAELRWYMKVFLGERVTPNTGKAGVYEGVQVWPEATYAYHPGGQAGDVYLDRGFPAIPGLLQAAVSATLDADGVRPPWYAIYGNHDVLFMGSFPVGWALRRLATGGAKASELQALAGYAGAGVEADSIFGRMATSTVWNQMRGAAGIHRVTPDRAREQFPPIDYMEVHLDSPKGSGPLGHGFTKRDLDSSKTWWAHDITPYLRVIGLDSTNKTLGQGGTMSEEQFRWLEGELRGASSRYVAAGGMERSHAVRDKLVIVCSHHPSWNFEDMARPVTDQGQHLYTGGEVLALLLRYPNVVAWVNGHTHYNEIRPHRQKQAGMLWEVNTASGVDYPQQGRLIDVVDNRDGTLSLFTISVDHAAPVQVDYRDHSPAGLASIARELAANDWLLNPDVLGGSAFDRNCELLVPAPFDLSTISDAEVTEAHMAQRARLMAARGQIGGAGAGSAGAGSAGAGSGEPE